jgi:hypothetical protein
VQFASEYYEHKQCIPIQVLGFAECSRHSDDRFELWDHNETTIFAIQPVDERTRPKWIQRLARMTVLHQQQKMTESATEGAPPMIQSARGSVKAAITASNKTRPQSWTTTSSSEDGCSGEGGGGSGSSRSAADRAATAGSSSSVHSNASSSRSSTASSSG